MKNNRKGFTLVELLAVIVILAILMVSAGAGVMATMNNSKVNLFKDEALTFIDGASRIYSDLNMNLGTGGGQNYLVSNRCKSSTTDASGESLGTGVTAGSLIETDFKIGTKECQADTYAGMCISLAGLIANGATDKETSKYAGVVLVEVPYDGGESRYTIWLHNSVYGINGFEKNQIGKLSFNKKNNTEKDDGTATGSVDTNTINGGNVGVVTTLTGIKNLIGKVYGSNDALGGNATYTDQANINIASSSLHGGTDNIYLGLTCINEKLH